MKSMSSFPSSAVSLQYKLCNTTLQGFKCIVVQASKLEVKLLDFYAELRHCLQYSVCNLESFIQ